MPLQATTKGRLGGKLIEILEQRLRFGLGPAINAGGEDWIHKQCLAARLRMANHNRVQDGRRHIVMVFANIGFKVKF